MTQPQVRRQVEAERKFALAPGQDLPDLSSIATPGRVAEFELRATYYDAADFRLTHAWQVIRHRVGGNDAGWHLKLPGPTPEQRLEHHLPGDSARVPAQFRKLVERTLAGAALYPVAVLRTHRRERELLGPDGAVLALTCTDDVTAEVGTTTKRWREAEIELVGGTPTSFLDAVTEALAEVGIQPAAGAAKIGHALSGAMAQAAALRFDVHTSTAAVVRAYLAEQVGVLQQRESDVEVDAPDAVHRSRVATRRLRSALRTYAAVFAGSTSGLREDLRWYAEELGAPRDAEVLRERLADAVEELPEAARPPVTQRIQRQLDQVHADALAELHAAMRTDRYTRLHLDLEGLLASPRWSQRGEDPAVVVLPQLLERAVAKVRRATAHAQARPSDLTRWHEVRKAAKAARYGAELLLPVLGERAEAWRAGWESVTEALGAVQDAVVAQQLIGDLAWDAVAAGEDRRAWDDLRFAQDAKLRRSLAAGREALAAALEG